MSRWLIVNVPTWVLLLALITVVVGGAVLVLRLLRSRFPGLTRGEHNDATTFTYGFIGFVYAFLVGFIVSTLWGQISGADGQARAEGAAATQLGRDAAAFAAPDRIAVRRALLAYETEAIAEWDTDDSRRSPRADDALAALYTSYQRVTVTTDAQKAALTTSLTNLDTASQARTVRLLTAREDAGPPWPLWAIILIFSMLVMGTVVVYGVERAGLHYTMVTIVGVIVATNIMLMLELAHPYLGTVSTTSDPLRQAAELLAATTDR